MPTLYIGTSGWAYPSWKPDFYPEKLAQKKFLNFYASKLNAVEVNYTFRARERNDRPELDRRYSRTVSLHHQAHQVLTHINA